MFHLAAENKFDFDLCGDIYSTLLDRIGLMDQKISFSILQQLQNVKAADYFRNLLQKDRIKISRYQKVLGLSFRTNEIILEKIKIFIS